MQQGHENLVGVIAMFAQQLLHPKRIEPGSGWRYYPFTICPTGMDNRLLIYEKSGFFLFINSRPLVKESNVY